MSSATSSLGLDVSEFRVKSGEAFSTAEDAVKAMKTHFHQLGFTIKKKRDNRDRMKTGVPTKHVYVCGCGGIFKEPTRAEPRQKKTSTHLCACMWKATIHERAGLWTIVFKNTEHNHEKTSDIKSQPQARVRTPMQKEIIRNMSDRGSSASDILEVLNSGPDECQLVHRDIYNTRKLIKREDLEGKSEMQFLFEKLSEDSTKFSSQHDKENSCTNLLLVMENAIQFTKDYSQVVQMDSTYRTNRYGMPLLHIVGRTSTNNTFTIALCFMRSETETNYTWALTELARHLDGQMCSLVILTDRELALINAVETVFPTAKHVLCVWHITKNISANCKALFPAKKNADAARQDKIISWDEFSKLWSGLVVHTRDMSEFEKSWSQLAASIPSGAVEYIMNSWLVDWRERFCAPYLLNSMHFGSGTTSRVEGCHAALKRWIPSGNLRLLHVYKAIRHHSARQYETCRLSCERQKERRLIVQKDGGILEDVQQIVAHQALELALKQYQKSKNSHSPVQPCTRCVRVCFGVPCSHIIAQVVQSAAALRTPARLQHYHFDRFWLLDKEICERQRPSHPLSPLKAEAQCRKRALLQFEHTDIFVSKQRGLRMCGFCKQYANHNKAGCPKRKEQEEHCVQEQGCGTSQRHHVNESDFQRQGSGRHQQQQDQQDQQHEPVASTYQQKTRLREPHLEQRPGSSGPPHQAYEQQHIDCSAQADHRQGGGGAQHQSHQQYLGGVPRQPHQAQVVVGDVPDQFKQQRHQHMHCCSEQEHVAGSDHPHQHWHQHQQHGLHSPYQLQVGDMHGETDRESPVTSAIGVSQLHRELQQMLQALQESEQANEQASQIYQEDDRSLHHDLPLSSTRRDSSDAAV